MQAAAGRIVDGEDNPHPDVRLVLPHGVLETDDIGFAGLKLPGLMTVLQPACEIDLRGHVERWSKRRVENRVAIPVGEGVSAGALSIEMNSSCRRNCERKVSEKEEGRCSVSGRERRGVLGSWV